MKISFTGINNLQIGQSKQIQKTYSLYPSVTGGAKYGEIENREYKVRVDLTDDYAGKDYNELLVAMGKAQRGLNTVYLRTPNKVELHMIEHKVLDDDIFKDYSYSTFKLNGQDIPIMGTKDLPLYTYLAKLTRNILEQFNLSENQRNVINNINQSIQNEAERFIDLM